MSLSYFVDGYNVMHRAMRMDSSDLAGARESFLGLLSVSRPQGSARNRLVVVFDGCAQVSNIPLNYPFEVIFTSGSSADEMICRLVNDSSSPRNIVVVTDDRDLSRSVRGAGADVMRVDDFLSKIRIRRSAKNRKALRGIQESALDLDIAEREKITRELKKIWLREKSS